MGVKVGFETLNQLNMGYMFNDSKCVHEEALGFHQDWKTSTPKTGIEPPKAKLWSFKNWDFNGLIDSSGEGSWDQSDWNWAWDVTQECGLGRNDSRNAYGIRIKPCSSVGISVPLATNSETIETNMNFKINQVLIVIV